LNKLLQSQQHDRSKMKQKLMDKILARKRKRAAEDNFASTETADEMLEAAENEAKDLLQDEEARARTEMIRPLLLAMSAAEMMDPVLMTSTTTGGLLIKHFVWGQGLSIMYVYVIVSCLLGFRCEGRCG
jgi:hypothetical protein